MRIEQLHCFQHVRWQPDRQELRRFAAAMLVGFLVLGLIAAWRRHALEGVTWSLWGVGFALAVGALTPGLGRLVYLGVYLPSSLVGYLLSYVLLTLIFFLVFTPLGVLLRCMRKDLLQLQRPSRQSLWLARPAPGNADSYYRQF